MNTLLYHIYVILTTLQWPKRARTPISAELQNTGRERNVAVDETRKLPSAFAAGHLILREHLEERGALATIELSGGCYGGKTERENEADGDEGFRHE